MVSVSEEFTTNPAALQKKRPRKVTLKAPLPSKDDIPIFGITIPTDYVTCNAVANILSKPDVHDTKGFDYLKKADFGKIPKYIARIKRDIEVENQLETKLREQEEAVIRSKKRLLTSEERMNLISGLNAKWRALNSEYQKITHMTVLDTVGKIRRKETYEEQLVQTENDIKLLSRNDDIYIDLEH